MLLIDEDAWALSLKTLKDFARGKVGCKHAQRRAFEALATIRTKHPEAFTDDEAAKALTKTIEGECGAKT